MELSEDIPNTYDGIVARAEKIKKAKAKLHKEIFTKMIKKRLTTEDTLVIDLSKMGEKNGRTI